MKLSDKQLRRIVRSELLHEAQLSERGEAVAPWKYKIGGKEFKFLTKDQEKSVTKAFKDQQKAAKAELKKQMKAGKLSKADYKKLLALSHEAAQKEVINVASAMESEELAAQAAAQQLQADTAAAALVSVKATAKAEGWDVDDNLLDAALRAAALEQIEVPGGTVAGGDAARGADVKPLSKTLRRGSKGDEVKKVQELLSKIGNSEPDYADIATDVDSDYGGKTKAAVIEFQKSGIVEPLGLAPLDVDGVVGPKTWEGLVRAAAAAGGGPAAKPPAPKADDKKDDKGEGEGAGGAGGAGGEVQKESRRRRAKKLNKASLRRVMAQELMKL